MGDVVAAWIALDARYQAGGDGGDGLHLVRHGARSLVFTAPHSVRHLRRGVEKRSDIRTGGLAELLAAAIGARCLTATGRPSFDANWHPEPTPFRAALLELLRPGDLVVDLHGMGDGHGADVVIGLGPSPDGRSGDAAATLERFLAGHRLSARRGHPFAALHPGTVTAAVQAAGFSGLQVEVAARRRHPLRQPELAAPLVHALLGWARAVGAGPALALS